jgi:hypothetical protein
MVVGAATLDGYSRQLLNDKTNNELEQIEIENNKLEEEGKAAYNNRVSELAGESKNKATMAKYPEAADEFQKEADSYSKNPSEYRQYELTLAPKKLDQSKYEIKELNTFDSFYSLYTSYNEYLDSLTLDKIVCLFNIILGFMTLSSFVAVLSILLSEKIITKFKFLDKYPIILEILKLRNYINKKIITIYLFLHLIMIISGILSNIYMFFLK